SRKSSRLSPSRSRWRRSSMRRRSSNWREGSTSWPQVAGRDPMLFPVQTSGKKPPLFFVHGLREIMPLGQTFAAGLGSDRPLYFLRAVAGEGGQLPIADMCTEIRRIRPSGPLRIIGLRQAALPALGLARGLLQQKVQIGPVVLVDPPPLTSSETVPFPDPVELILTPQVAAGFLHPQMAWQKLLQGPRIAHVLPWNSEDLLRAGCDDVICMLKFILEQVPTLMALARAPTQTAPA